MRNKNGTMRNINKMKEVLALIVVAVLFLMMIPKVFAESSASQKSYFGSGESYIVGLDGEVLISGQIKTSTVGDLLIGFSMECALWTQTQNKASKGGKETSSSSRAAVNVTVKVNGMEAKPGQVVYCDREQTVDLQFLSDDTENITNDAILLGIFQKTKNANHFNFYYQNPGTDVHTIEVYVDSVVEYSADSPQIVIENTRAVVGKHSLVVQEYNNP